MNQVFAGGLALIIALILWSSKKQSKASAFFKSQKDSFSKAQVESTSLVIDKNFEIFLEGQMISGQIGRVNESRIHAQPELQR